MDLQVKGKRFCQTSNHPRFRAEQVHQQFASFLEQLIPIGYFKTIYQKVLKQIISGSFKEQWAKKMKLTNKIEALLYKNEKIKSLLLSDSIEIEDYKSMKKDCEVQKEILEETLTTTNSMIQKIIDIVKNGITRISHLSELYKVLSTDEKKEIVNYLFPHYITYTESCFNHTNISESLQFIYTESYRPGHQLQMQAPAIQHIPNSAIIDDTFFF